MFAYCNNNPITGYDPEGLVNWGGVAVGIGIGILAIAAVALTVATAGAASPLLAVVGSSVGTAMSAALIETSIVTTTGAIAEVPVVYDTTVVAGNTRVGYSAIYDFGNDTADLYMHRGAQNQYEFSATWGTGFVFNHTERGSYAGEFVDTSYSTNYRGANVGLDFCTSPDNLNADNFMQEGTSALLFTSGIGSSIFRSRAPLIAYDYYEYVAAF